MAGDFDRLEGLFTGGQKLTLLRGIVVPAATLTNGATGYLVNVNGSVIPISALDSATASIGDSVLVAVVDSGKGQAEAIVLGRMSTLGLHPATGTVTSVPPSSPTITVLGADGVSYTAYFLSSYTPAVNDNVEMTWLAGIPYVTKTGATPAPPTAAPVSSGTTTIQTGTVNYAASDSATYWSGGWSSPGSASPYGNPDHVYTGTYNGNTVHGAWFYGGGPTQLNGRNIGAGRFMLGARDIGAGNYNTPASVNLYTHSAPTRPGGDITILSGPWTVTAQPWQGATAYSITPAMINDLVVSGGGIAISGGDYAAYQGIQANALSGSLSFDWSR